MNCYKKIKEVIKMSIYNNMPKEIVDKMNARKLRKKYRELRKEIKNLRLVIRDRKREIAKLKEELNKLGVKG